MNVLRVVAALTLSSALAACSSGVGGAGAKGATGDTGPAGATGPTGPAGPKGDKGDTGDNGLKGDTGLKGDQGDPGLKGDKGDTGNKGDKGDKGEPGNNGDAGSKGDKGDPGPAAGLSWRPDGAGDATTWAEVMAAVSASKAPITIHVSQFAPDGEDTPTYVIPGPDTVYDLHGSTIAAPVGGHSAIVINIGAGAVLHNLAGVSGGMTLKGHPTAGAPCLTFTTVTEEVGPVFTIEKSASVVNDSADATPMIITPAQHEFFLVFKDLAGECEQGTGGGSLVQISPGQPLNVVVIGGWAFEEAPSSRLVSSADENGALIYVHDGSGPPPSVFANAAGGFQGYIINAAFGGFGGSGPLDQRPYQTAGLRIGATYFATDITASVCPTGCTITWDGGTWRDPTGAVVPNGAIRGKKKR